MICSAGSDSHWMHMVHIDTSSRWFGGGYSIQYNCYIETTVYG